MTVKQFEELCKKHGVELGDLPIIPPKNMTDEKWKALIEMIGKSKKTITSNNMDRLQAIEYLNKNEVYTDEWSGAGMWEAVREIMDMEDGEITKEVCDELLKKAEEK